MPGKRISDLTALTGAGSASTDDLVIFDTDASATKRITRAQLAVGMQADTQTLTNKTIDSANNTLTVNAKEATLEATDGSRVHEFKDVAALLADTGLVATTGSIIRTRSEGFSYQVAASGASDHHIVTAGGVKLYRLEFNAELVQPPSGFGWDFATYPVNIQRHGDKYSTDFDPHAYINTAVNGATYYVSEDGINTNAGTVTAPVRSIWRARELGEANASVTGYTIVVYAPRNRSAFCRDHAFNDPSGLGSLGFGVRPTKHVRMIARDGVVETGAFVAPDAATGSTFSWTVDGTDPLTWSGPRSNVLRVYDLQHYTPDGDPFEYRKVADLAAVRASSGGAWAQDGSNTTVYVKRPDGGRVTHLNTRIMLQTTGHRPPNDKDFSASGFEFWGGSSGTVEDASGSGTADRVYENCKFILGTNIGSSNDNFRINTKTGLLALLNCRAIGGSKDAFNINAASPAVLHILTVNCSVSWSGEQTTTTQGNSSCNAYTLHTQCYGIDLNGDYRNTHGGAVRNIDGTQMWALGTIAANDAGDTMFTQGDGVTYGAGLSTAFQTGNTARMWLQDCRAIGCERSVGYGSGTIVLLRRFVDGGGSRVGGGTIGSF